MEATGEELGLLIHFGHHPRIQHERFVNQRDYEKGERRDQTEPFMLCATFAVSKEMST